MARNLPFKNSSQVSRNPGLQAVSGTPQQANGGKQIAVMDDTDFPTCA